MRIVQVTDREAKPPIAIEITEDVDVEFLSEIVKNTYNDRGAYARLRGEREGGAGGIDITYGSGYDDREFIPNGATGWLVLDQRWALFYKSRESMEKEWQINEPVLRFANG